MKYAEIKREWGNYYRGRSSHCVSSPFNPLKMEMDAFAVAICKGLGMRRINYRHTFIIALFFGGFQALMPFLGWLLGSRFAQYITRYDHWIAFVLLLFIGGKMVWDTLHEDCKEV